MANDISEIKRNVLSIYPFFGGLVNSLEFVNSEKVRTIANNGKSIFYNLEYLSSLEDDEQTFLLSHELCHIAFDHIRRSKGKNPVIWRKATDSVINQLLKKDGLEIIKGAADYPQARGCSAEEFYEVLLNDNVEMEFLEGGLKQLKETGGSYDDESHSMWEDAIEEQEEEKDEPSDEEIEDELDRVKDLIENADDSDALGGTDDEENDDEDEEYAVTAQKISKSGEEVVDNDVREVEEPEDAEPLIDWRLILRETVNYGLDWSYRNAILESGIVRPALEEIPMPETEIVVDTSWSVDEVLLNNFLKECRNLLKVSKLKIGCFDTQFYGFHEINNEDDLKNMKFNGGGGTDFDVAAGAFTLRVENKIIFTDGKAPMPEKHLDIIWMVYGEEAIEPEGGRVFHITPEQLERLTGKK